jgi:hypothetical protein
MVNLLTARARFQFAVFAHTVRSRVIAPVSGVLRSWLVRTSIHNWEASTPPTRTSLGSFQHMNACLPSNSTPQAAALGSATSTIASPNPRNASRLFTTW